MLEIHGIEIIEVDRIFCSADVVVCDRLEASFITSLETFLEPVYYTLFSVVLWFRAIFHIFWINSLGPSDPIKLQIWLFRNPLMNNKSHPMIQSPNKNDKHSFSWTLMKFFELILKLFNLLLSHLDETKADCKWFHENSKIFIVISKRNYFLVEVEQIAHHVSF